MTRLDGARLGRLREKNSSDSLTYIVHLIEEGRILLVQISKSFIKRYDNPDKPYYVFVAELLADRSFYLHGQVWLNISMCTDAISTVK